jgi:hypothetical protein
MSTRRDFIIDEDVLRRSPPMRLFTFASGVVVGLALATNEGVRDGVKMADRSTEGWISIFAARTPTVAETRCVELAVVEAVAHGG